jgi:hypothetical protein
MVVLLFPSIATSLVLSTLTIWRRVGRGRGGLVAGREGRTESPHPTNIHTVLTNIDTLLANIETFLTNMDTVLENISIYIIVHMQATFQAGWVAAGWEGSFLFANASFGT